MQFRICTWDLQLPCHVRSCFLLTHHIWLSEKRTAVFSETIKSCDGVSLGWESFWSKKNGKIDDLGQVEQPPIADLSQVIRTEYILNNT